MVVSKRTAIERVKEICDSYKISITQYDKDEEFPYGTQSDNDVITIKPLQRLNFDGDDPFVEIQYSPWIRVMPNNLTEDEFLTILNQGQRVYDCVVELNQYLSSVKIKAI